MNHGLNYYKEKYNYKWFCEQLEKYIAEYSRFYPQLIYYGQDSFYLELHYFNAVNIGIEDYRLKYWYDMFMDVIKLKVDSNFLWKKDTITVEQEEKQINNLVFEIFRNQVKKTIMEEVSKLLFYKI